MPWELQFFEKFLFIVTSFFLLLGCELTVFKAVRSLHLEVDSQEILPQGRVGGDCFNVLNLFSSHVIRDALHDSLLSWFFCPIDSEDVLFLLRVLDNNPSNKSCKIEQVNRRDQIIALANDW
jgi:hypothetical protein